MEKGALSKGATNEQFDTEVDKFPPRVNIIELMQLSQNYPSSERLETDSEKFLSKPNQYYAHSETSRPKMGVTTKSYIELTKTGPSKSYPNASDSRHWNFEKFAKINCDRPKSFTKEIDANDCAECIQNNFWIKKNVFNKSADDKLHDLDHHKKKKTTTFHTDSSLLTFHNLSPRSHEDIDLKSHPDIDLPNRDIDYKTDLDYKSIQQEIEAHDRQLEHLDRYERFLEFEKDTIDYEREWKEERVQLEKRRIETEQLIYCNLWTKILASQENIKLLRDRIGVKRADGLPDGKRSAPPMDTCNTTGVIGTLPDSHDDEDDDDS
ncbi:unnamed protein product [Spodoptera exigua]|nr:unnamed protein product [Spodoptera exigua]